MKKVLFATTALIATAGVAAADVTINGNGRMGVVHNDSATASDAETQFNSRIRIGFAASGETDNGLSFGGSIRADNAANGAAGTAGSVFVTGDFGTITMGDIDSAAESAVGNVAGVGYVNPNDRSDMGYIAESDDEGVAFKYSIEGLSVFASAGQPQTASADNQTSFGASYTMNGFTVAAGRSEDGSSDQTAVSVRGAVAGVNFAVVMLDNDSLATNAGEVAASISYTMDALTLTAFTREVDVRAAGTHDPRYTGIGASYNLGGGARLSAGYVDGGANGNDLDSYDIGMTFSF